MEFASLPTGEAGVILDEVAPVENQIPDRKAWPAAVGLGLLLACVAALGFSAYAPHKAYEGAPAALQLFHVTQQCEAATTSGVATINAVLAELPDPAKPDAKMVINGPEVKVVCKARTFLIFDVTKIKGLSSGSAAAVCEDATLSASGKVTGQLAANISFAEPISVSLKLKEKGSFCHVPHSYRQTVDLSISGLSISSEFLFSEHNLPRPTVTSASLRFLKIRWDKVSLECEGQGCPGREERQDREWARVIVETGLSNHIEGMINAQLADMVPYKVPLKKDSGEDE